MKEFDYDGLNDSEDERLEKNIFNAIMLIEASRLRLQNKNSNADNSNTSDASKLQMLFKRLLAIQKLSEINKKYATPASEDSPKELGRSDAPQEKDKNIDQKQPEKLNHYKFFEKPIQHNHQPISKPTTIKPKLLVKINASGNSLLTTKPLEASKNHDQIAITSSSKNDEFVTSLPNEQETGTLQIFTNSFAPSSASISQTLANVSDSESDNPQKVTETLEPSNASNSTSMPTENQAPPNETAPNTDGLNSSQNDFSQLIFEGRMSKNEDTQFLNMSHEHDQVLTKQHEEYLEQILQEAINALKSQNANYMDMIDSILNQTNETREAQEPEPVLQSDLSQKNDKRAIEDDLAKIMTSWDNVDLTTLLLSQTTNPANATLKDEQAIDGEQNFITASTLSLLRSLPNNLDQLKGSFDEIDLEESLTPEQIQFLNDLWQRSKRSIYKNLRRQRLNSMKKKKNKQQKSLPSHD